MSGLMFSDRRHAGRSLADVVRRLALNDPLVLALPRGGVPVAVEVANALHAPLDVIMVKRLRESPVSHNTFAAIAIDGTRAFNDDLAPDMGGIGDSELDTRMDRILEELEIRERRYRRDAAGRPEVEGRDVILVADGMATGVSMMAAATSVRRKQPARILVAVPTASQYAERRLLDVCDDVICLDNPEAFFAIGCCYREFEPTTDEQILELLESVESGLSSDDTGRSAAG